VPATSIFSLTIGIGIKVFNTGGTEGHRVDL
jgi:hypothetical protein